MSNVAIAIDQILAARKYTNRILADIDPALWFRMPSEGVTHIAWQAGHIAIAEYRLGVCFRREPTPDDDAWFPKDWLKIFGRGSVPQADAAMYPPIETILAAQQRIHSHVLDELRSLDETSLDAPAIVLQHPIVATKLDALFWCSRHEMVHAGQIALLKRLLGHAPQW